MGGVGILMRHGGPTGAPRNEADTLAQTLWHSARWCHFLLGLGRGADSLHAQMAYGISSQPALNRIFWDQATRYVVHHGAAPQLVGGGRQLRPQLPAAGSLVYPGVSSGPPAGGRGP